MRPKDNRPRQTNGDAVLCLCYYGGRKKRFIGTPPRPHLQPSPPPLDDGELNKNPPTPPRRSAVPHHKAELGGRCPRGAETNPWVWSKQSSRKKTKKKVITEKPDLLDQEVQGTSFTFFHAVFIHVNIGISRAGRWCLDEVHRLFVMRRGSLCGFYARLQQPRRPPGVASGT